MAKRRVQLGATGENVRQNVAAARRWGLGGQPMTVRALADRLNESGVRTAHSALSEIENGARRVDVDDLTALAAALGVSPLFLLLPHSFEEGEAVELSGVGKVPLRTAWAWMRDGLPLDPDLRSKSDQTRGPFVEELHEDEQRHQGAVLLGLAGVKERGDVDEEVHDLLTVFWRRLIEAGAFVDRHVTFERFREHFARMMRELAKEEGVAEWLHAEFPDDPAGPLSEVPDPLAELRREWRRVMHNRRDAVDLLNAWNERRQSGVLEQTRQVAPERIRETEIWIGLLDHHLEDLRAAFYARDVDPPDETRRQLTAEEVAESFPDYPEGWVAWEKVREPLEHDDIRLERTESGWQVHRGDG